jgi:hypothetical protein
MKTTKGTYYGEILCFTAGEAPTGIEEFSPERLKRETITVKARYDIQGRKIDKPVPGMNILLMSDGTTKKVIIK